MGTRQDRMVVAERALMDQTKDDWYIDEEVIDELALFEYEVYCQECQEELE